MPQARAATFKGVNITPLVTAWGKVEQIKDVLLVTASAMTSEMSIECANRSGVFSPGGNASLVSGLNWYNGLLAISVDGAVQYEGLVKNVKTNQTTQTSVVVSENVLKRPAESVVSYAKTGQNPGDAMLAVLRAGSMPDAFVDLASFARAGALARAANARVDVNFTTGGNATVLTALQAIGDVASISVYVSNNRITARAFRPYTGNEAGLRNEISDAIVREWGDHEWDTSAFNNRVLMGYAGGSYLTLDEKRSQAETGVVRELQFPATGNVIASDKASAQYFGALYLQRAAPRKMLLPIAAGRELSGVALGDRFPVTNLRLGLVREPFEAIEVHRSLDTEEVEIRLASLRAIAVRS